MKPYYHVYRTDETRGPKVKHPTLQSAQTEAERVANQHPGSTFVILKAVAVVRCTVASTFWMDGEAPPGPVEPAPSDHYPPFDLPEGYDRWVCRGLEWKAQKVFYVITENGKWYDCRGPGKADANGVPDYEYWEAVKDTTEEPYRSLGLNETLQKGDQLMSNGHWIPAVDSIGLELGKSEFPAARRPL